MARFDAMTLLILISPQTFSSPCWLRILLLLLASTYSGLSQRETILHLSLLRFIFFSLLRYAHRSSKNSCFFQIFRFYSGSSIKQLSSKIKKMFLLSMVQFYRGRTYHHPCKFKTYQLRQLRRLHRTNICESNN